MEDQKTHVQFKKLKSKEISVFLFFVLFATLMWLLIKLSDRYDVIVEFKLKFENLPVEKWMPLPHEQTLKTTITATGFSLLHFYTLGRESKNVMISLDQIPYRHSEANSYYIGSQYIRDAIAALTHVSTNDISVPENEIFFTLEPLKSKIVPVKLNYDFRYRKQYGMYGIPQWSPKEIEIFGAANMIDTLQAVYTKKIEREDLYENLETDVLLDFQNNMQSKTKITRLQVEVERFTEATIAVPIESVEQPKLRYFPDHVTIYYNVAMRDFRRIDPKLFQVRVDILGLQTPESFLKLEVIPPSNVHIIRYEPEQVEYLILE